MYSLFKLKAAHNDYYFIIFLFNYFDYFSLFLG